MRLPAGPVSRDAIRRCCGVAILACVLAAMPPLVRAERLNDYTIGPQDVLSITVLNQAGLGGKYAVELDGSFSFPLIGRIQASGLTTAGLETELRKRLADGFFNTPEVTVAIEQYRSQRVYVMGEVRNPGVYSLPGDMTLFGALATAGSTTSQAGEQVVIIRGAQVRPGVVPQPGEGDVVQLSLNDLQGAAAVVRDIGLRDGDAIYVPRAGLVYVFGQVKNPGSYAFRSGTTVLQALSLAGGITSSGATNRVNVMRVVNGNTSKIKVKLSDVIEAGDTIVVPEKFF